MSKVILVTGATSGIGRHAALELARKGHHVIAAGRRKGALDALAAEEIAGRGRLDGVVLDVTSSDSIARAVETVMELTGGHGVDVLVNNAGYGQLGPLEMVTDAELRAQFDTNIFGLMAVTRAFLPKMRENGGGRIVNVGSIGGRMTFPMMGAYHATKYALEAISDALRNELAPFGIHVSLVEPGAINTEFNDVAMDGLAAFRVKSSPYAAVLERADAVRKNVERTGAGPEATTKVITHAALGRRPSARYVAPFSGRLAIVFFALVPSFVTDWALRAIMGLRWRSRPAPLALALGDAE